MSNQASQLDTITSITGSQLSINESMITQTNSMNLSISRSYLSDIPTTISSSSYEIQIPDTCAIIGARDCSEATVVQQLYSRPSALNLNSDIGIGNSSSMSLSFYGANMKEYSVSGYSQGFYFYIAMNPPQTTFELVNITSLNLTGSNQLLTYSFELTSPNQSVTIELRPTDMTIGYLVVLKYGQVPVITSTSQVYDKFQVFCPSGTFEPLFNLLDHF